MTTQPIESLEKRQLLSAAPTEIMGPFALAPLGGPGGSSVTAPLAPDSGAGGGAVGGANLTGSKKAGRRKVQADPRTTALAPSDVENILAAAASQARNRQAIAVVDREGTVLGVWAGGFLSFPTIERRGSIANTIVELAVARARTAAFFQSNQEAFTTRTARFIIQNHFPFPIKNTPGGPLYGVEFSSFEGSDILLPDHQSGISGDPGGVPLYIGGVAVGGIGVAGDFSDIAPAANLLPVTTRASDYGRAANPNERVYTGDEEPDFDEAVAKAGARRYAGPAPIRANHIYVDGLQFPFAATARATGKPQRTLADLTATGEGQLVTSIRNGLTTPTLRAGEPERVNAVVAGVAGLFRIRDNALHTGPNANPQESDPVIASDDVDLAGNLLSDAQRLTEDAVMYFIQDAVRQATITRAGIRKPNGLHMVIHVAVVDRDGTVLGVFRMDDGTNFSYDVAVQKARTSAFFSDDNHAFTPRGIGFMAQAFYPAGIERGIRGPLYQLQDQLMKRRENLLQGPLPNGITVFPGGAPLYKNGVMVGAVGISGDGVDQDDLASFAGQKRFQPRREIRSDELPFTEVRDWIISRAAALQNDPTIRFDFGFDAVARARDAFSQIAREEVDEIRIPYVKFPRNPLVE